MGACRLALNWSLQPSALSWSYAGSAAEKNTTFIKKNSLWPWPLPTCHPTGSYAMQSHRLKWNEIRPQTLFTHQTLWLPSRVRGLGSKVSQKWEPARVNQLSCCRRARISAHRKGALKKHTHCGVMVSGKCEWCHSLRLLSWVAWQ